MCVGFNFTRKISPDQLTEPTTRNWHWLLHLCTFTEVDWRKIDAKIASLWASTEAKLDIDWTEANLDILWTEANLDIHWTEANLDIHNKELKLTAVLTWTEVEHSQPGTDTDCYAYLKWSCAWSLCNCAWTWTAVVRVTKHRDYS